MVNALIISTLLCSTISMSISVITLYRVKKTNTTIKKNGKANLKRGYQVNEWDMLSKDEKRFLEFYNSSSPSESGKS